MNGEGRNSHQDPMSACLPLVPWGPHSEGRPVPLTAMQGHRAMPEALLSAAAWPREVLMSTFWKAATSLLR